LGASRSTLPGYVHGTSRDWVGVCPFGVQTSDTDQWLVGDCPTCDHPIRKRISGSSDVALLDGTRATKPAGEAKPATYLITCNCAYGHDDAPERVRGCGAQGAVLVTPQRGGPAIVTYADPDVDAWDADEWVERAERDQLLRLREFAGQWASMLGVVTGLVSVGTIFDFTRGDLLLHGAYLWGYVAASALALAAAVLAVWLASQAAGLKQFDRVPDDLEGRGVTLQQARAFCRDRLTWSKWSALAAVILIALALALRFAGEK